MDNESDCAFYESERELLRAENNGINDSNGYYNDVIRPVTAKPLHANFTYKIIKSIMVSNTFTFTGLTQAIITPSIDDLKNQVGCNYEEFTHAFVFGPVGGLIGALVGGYLADRFQEQVDLLMGIELIVGAVARAALPWAPNLIILGTLFAIKGIALGACNPTSNAHLIVIWGAQASSPMQLLHMGYGLGTIVSPLLVEPFLSHPINSSSHNHSNIFDHHVLQTESESIYPTWISISQNHSVLAEESNITYTESNIYKPFAAIASYGALSGCIFLLFYFIPSEMAKGQRSRVTKKANAIQIFNPGECADGLVIYGFTMIGLLFTLYLLNNGKDCSVNVFMYAVAVDKAFAFSPFQGSLLTTGYYAGYALGRAVYSILGLCVSVQLLLFSEVIGMLAVHTSLALIGLDAPLNFAICICISGFFAGPMVPSMMTWMDRYIKMTALAFASLSVGINTGAFLFNWISGYIFQQKQPVDLYYLSLVCAITVALLITFGQVLGLIHGDRYKAMEQKQVAQSQVQSTLESESLVERGAPASNDKNGLIQ